MLWEARGHRSQDLLASAPTPTPPPSLLSHPPRRTCAAASRGPRQTAAAGPGQRQPPAPPSARRGLQARAAGRLAHVAPPGRRVCNHSQPARTGSSLPRALQRALAPPARAPPPGSTPHAPTHTHPPPTHPPTEVCGTQQHAHSRQAVRLRHVAKRQTQARGGGRTPQAPASGGGAQRAQRGGGAGAEAGGAGAQRPQQEGQGRKQLGLERHGPQVVAWEAGGGGRRGGVGKRGGETRGRQGMSNAGQSRLPSHPSSRLAWESKAVPALPQREGALTAAAAGVQV